jgi:hypothetical protein
MKYDDPKMERYFHSLPPEVQNYINRSDAEIASLGDLMLIGEHFKISFGYDESGQTGE